jgi:cation transport regulator ChaB
MHRDREFAKWYRKEGADCPPVLAQAIWNAAWEAAIDTMKDSAVERLMAGQHSREVTAADVRAAIR